MFDKLHSIAHKSFQKDRGSASQGKQSGEVRNCPNYTTCCGPIIYGDCVLLKKEVLREYISGVAKSYSPSPRR